MSKQDRTLKFYTFLTARAEGGDRFTLKDVVKATDWKISTARTYLGKQVRDYIEKPQRGKYEVDRSFLRLSEEDYLKLVSQKERGRPKYVRRSYEFIVTYEFLLPLTREDKLRKALDNLFYKDTLEKRLLAIEPDALTRIIPARREETRGRYIERVADQFSKTFAGYSINHVNGRFLYGELATRADAIDRRYLIDETTAVVRFIARCSKGKRRHGTYFDVSDEPVIDERELQLEVNKIRMLFLLTFVETVVQEVFDEDEIWVIENAPDRTRLYVWERE